MLNKTMSAKTRSLPLQPPRNRTSFPLDSVSRAAYSAPSSARRLATSRQQAWTLAAFHAPIADHVLLILQHSTRTYNSYMKDERQPLRSDSMYGSEPRTLDGRARLLSPCDQRYQHSRSWCQWRLSIEFQWLAYSVGWTLPRGVAQPDSRAWSRHSPASGKKLQLVHQRQLQLFMLWFYERAELLMAKQGYTVSVINDIGTIIAGFSGESG